MKRSFLLSLVLVLATGIVSTAAAQCVLTENTCNFSDTVTTSHLQIGGDGSSSGESPASPGELSDTTVAESMFDLSYNRLTGVLTLTVHNTTVTTATATGIFFNAPPAVTGMTLLSHTGTGLWELAFDSDRADAVVDTHPQWDYLRTQGFGVFSAFLGNNGTDTSKEAGNPESEIQSGSGPVTFEIQIQASNVSDFNACSFTRVTSTIPPGDKLVVGLVRFQGGPDLGYGYITPCEGGDLFVALAGFDTLAGDGHVALSWSTATERDNAGFAVLRREVRGGKTERLTRSLIPGRGSEVSGASYIFIDNSAVNGRKYHYMLEDWDLSGMNTIHPPKRSVPNPPNPPIKLHSPAYEESLLPGMRLGWSATSRMRFRVEISTDPSFPAGETMVLRNGRRSDRSLSRRELSQVQAMGTGSDEGGVYWRVVGDDGPGRRRGGSSLTSLISDVFFMTTP